MEKRFLLLFVIILLFPAFCSASRGISIRPVAPTGQKVTGDNWLFVIGIDSYLHWPRLKTAVNDARSVRDVLLERYHFDRSHLIELYDEDATRKNIIGKLRYLAKHVREDDTLFIFYAGHGHLDSITKEGSWIPVESGVRDASSWITNHDIKNYLKVDAIKAKHILLVSDSCFAGDFFRGHRGKLPEVTEKVIRKAWELPSRQAITSGGLEPVSDAGFGGNSVFSHFLIAALKENRKPYLIPSDLYPYIQAGVIENAEQYPQYGILQGTGGSQGGEYVFFLKQGARLDDLSAQARARQAELECLKRLEAQQEAARRREAAEIARREAELSALDARIAEMRRKLGTSAATSSDNLDNMLAMVRQKEAQQRRLEELKRKREEEEKKRRAELERLKAEKREKLKKQLQADIDKYKAIVSSPFGKDMKDAAWKSLVSKYPGAAEVPVGRIDIFRFVVVYGIKYELRKPFIEPITGMEFVWVPGGCFEMGCGSWQSDCDSDEKPVHEVCVDGFWIGKYEVTQGQWKRVMGNNPSKFKKGDDYPVERVSWDDAQEFIKRLNSKSGRTFRLPTEAEWEYACRSGGKEEKYCGGSAVDRLAWYWGNSGGSTHRVGTKAPNGLGIHDMSGNVWEWCEDWYDEDYYRNSPRNNPKCPSSGSYRVSRGGSWYFNPRFVRSAYRNRFRPRNRLNYLGFRLVLPPGQAR
ncbi:serine/threonine kinase [Dissulfuribacter thermophilus]|uniref:Serine/threonine kinase n=1 Tax=Dissulfuribacter thermophilus TaxID=1156395 RepID=A0A1B9F2N8_9BACT|nr:SUMF1/EgtB/PvdO family nonheme iron enzyme [Dissulfuribacter thermophilus]OCC14196.1 serine/threonine kinase [Dissulfuribacter thermophilus]